jgi:hypothetical protein
VLVVDVGALVCPDLGDVDALARLHLEAGRAGWTIRFRGACAELCALIRLAGLDEVLVVVERGVERGLDGPVEVVGQPERREQLRVEEAVEPRDPAV